MPTINLNLSQRDVALLEQIGQHYERPNWRRWNSTSKSGAVKLLLLHAAKHWQELVTLILIPPLGNEYTLEVVCVRLTEAEHLNWTELAQRWGTNKTQFMRALIRWYAQEQTEYREQYDLTAPFEHLAFDIRELHPWGDPAIKGGEWNKPEPPQHEHVDWQWQTPMIVQPEKRPLLDDATVNRLALIAFGLLMLGTTFFLVSWGIQNISLLGVH